jgi:nitrite reductase (NADH) small subunit
MARWIRLASLHECPVGSARELIAEDRVIAVFHTVEGQFHALDGICPHQGGPLGKGRLNGCILTCPWHGWQFNVATGQHQINASVKHPKYPLRVDGNDLFVDLDEANRG